MSEAKARPVCTGRAACRLSLPAGIEMVGTKLGKFIKNLLMARLERAKIGLYGKAMYSRTRRGSNPGSTRELQGGYRFIL